MHLAIISQRFFNQFFRELIATLSMRGKYVGKRKNTANYCNENKYIKYRERFIGIPSFLNAFTDIQRNFPLSTGVFFAVHAVKTLSKNSSHVKTQTIANLGACRRQPCSGHRLLFVADNIG